MYTAVEEIPDIVRNTRKAFSKGITKNLNWRVSQLQQMEKMLTEQFEIFSKALEKDLFMNSFLRETEILGYHEHIRSAISKIKQWNAAETTDTAIEVFPAKGQIVHEPLGVVLIISPWNYPLSLVIRPLIGAIAAGNAIIIKPSEVSENTAQAIASVFPKYFDPECIRIITGGIPESQCLLKEKFDKICYTGSTPVGREIMKAAAVHLTPVLLELGGKSPLIIDKNINLQKAVPRVMWGKFLNSGQTCIAPDYILVHKELMQQFLKESVAVIEKFYGKDQQSSNDLGRIINHRHVERLKGLLKGQDIYYGGKIDELDRFISPTLVNNPDPNSRLMNEEIFGPILPVIPINNIDEAIAFINERPKPLALYVFTDNQAVADEVINKTSSGAVGINETILHNICTDLPFGGVGESGMGCYNGKYSFEEFSHRKPILARKFTMNDPELRYPPYTPSKLASLARLKKIGALFPWIKKIFTGLLFVGLVVFIQYKLKPF